MLINKVHQKHQHLEQLVILKFKPKIKILAKKENIQWLLLNRAPKKIKCSPLIRGRRVSTLKFSITRLPNTVTTWKTTSSTQSSANTRLQILSQFYIFSKARRAIILRASSNPA